MRRVVTRMSFVGLAIALAVALIVPIVLSPRIALVAFPSPGRTGHLDGAWPT